MQNSQLSRFLRVSHGFPALQGRFFISRDFTDFERIFSQTHSFIKKTNKTARSNAAEKSISSTISKNKTSSHSSLSLSWTLLFIMLVKTHIGNPL